MGKVTSAFKSRFNPEFAIHAYNWNVEQGFFKPSHPRAVAVIPKMPRGGLSGNADIYSLAGYLPMAESYVVFESMPTARWFTCDCNWCMNFTATCPHRNDGTSSESDVESLDGIEPL